MIQRAPAQPLPTLQPTDSYNLLLAYQSNTFSDYSSSGHEANIVPATPRLISEYSHRSRLIAGMVRARRFQPPRHTRQGRGEASGIMVGAHSPGEGVCAGPQNFVRGASIISRTLKPERFRRSSNLFENISLRSSNHPNGTRRSSLKSSPRSRSCTTRIRSWSTN